MKPKLLCILHRSPPAHGAAKVGDFIGQSKKLQEKYDCKFITIKSSDTIGDIGKVNIKKLYFVVELYIKILFTLLSFRPDKIYFTASVNGVAFYRDVLLSTLWKGYGFIKDVDIFYHYHTKGVENFIQDSIIKLKLTRFFLKKVSLVLLSPLLESDFKRVDTYKKVLFLPNGVENNMDKEEFLKSVKNKYHSDRSLINVLYLAHMMKDKGYIEVLDLVKKNKAKSIHFHFAGSWQDQTDKNFFYDFIKKENLEGYITYHGFVNGVEKEKLFKQAHILVYPSKNDAFPLTLLESLSYGVPVVATNQGSIPYILDKESGIVISDIEELESAFEEAIIKLINQKTAYYCRERYLKHFSLEQFEENLVNLFL